MQARYRPYLKGTFRGALGGVRYRGSVDFELSEELVELQRSVRRLAQDKVAPTGPGDRPRPASTPTDVFCAFRDAGLLGLCLPEELGGSGAGILGLAVAIEEVAKYSNTAALMLLLTRLPTGPLLIAGTDEQQPPLPARDRRRDASGPPSGCPSPRPAAT